MAPSCGLIIASSGEPVPLKGISVDVQVKGFVADVSATLKYKNLEENAVEAVFVFPMDDDSAVYSFEATVEGKKIVAEIQEKEQAHKTYDEAVSQGQQAFLLEEDESSGDIFSCSVGNLLPGQEAEVTLCFVRELPVEADGAVRFVLPAVLNPRYTPEDHEMNVTAKRPYVPVDQIQYTLSLDASFQSPHGISRIESNCDITPVQYTDNGKTRAEVSLTEGHKFDRDVELLAYYTEANKPSVTVEAGLVNAEAGSLLADPVVMLNFYPNLPVIEGPSNCGEFIFLVDRSGSMTEKMNSNPNAPQRIQSAKETLILLLKSLPLGCYFNIFGFGSHFESFFPESVEYTQQSMDAALQKVSEIDSDFGGTEILQPLTKIYKSAGIAGHPRQLFVFTDGEVGNTTQVISEVRRNSKHHRCFTFGIGEGASTALIKGMALAGNGTCKLITGRDRMQPMVLQSLKHSLQPTVKDVVLKWTLPAGLEASLLSRPPTAIYQGQRCIIYAHLKGQMGKESEGDVCLEYKYNDDVFQNILRFSCRSADAERPTVHRLAAKALISELENGTDSDSEEAKKRILETSVQSGVISSLTAYVAVNKDTKKPVEGPPMRRDIPAPRPRNKRIIKMASFKESPEELFELCCDSTHVTFIPESAACDALEPTALLRLISLQNADGSWNPTSELLTALGISTDFQETLPDPVMDVAVWATVLAVIRLHASHSPDRAEWELLEGKALAWIRPRAGTSLTDLITAGNELLKSSVDPKVFGL
ncbi:von Willebrand factor A domain-containing protein 5A-like [Spea bombifrons]|uniref:von Willebrand factor A domain-containing protein 5A-like n=1 Tax=Spea bombifrons TaxID=233779 RepID=UPI002348F8CE|nr:von Willebrand factor A domain-containing protein 5A-like [Spea bombifrons]